LLYRRVSLARVLPSRRWVRAAFRALTVVALCAALAGCASAAPSRRTSADRVGLTIFARSAQQKVTNLSGRTLGGSRFSLRALRGHVVVVNVWASWCTECRRESPLLARLSRRLKSRGVAFVGIDERDDAAAARRFATRAGARYPELFDPSSELLALLPQLPQMGIPSTLIVDRSGRAAARIIGAAHAAELRHALGAATRNG
jgi:thiol-disulfide isomerase/thioredoxin